MQTSLFRKVPRVFPGRQIRWSSSLLRDLQTLQLDAKSLLQNKTFSPEELEDLHELLKSDIPAETANHILQFGLPHDFSLYFTVGKREEPHKWDDLALLALVESNPGRVIPLTDLVAKHSNGPISQAVRQAVLKKLLHGERAEIRDGEFELTETNVKKAIQLLNELARVEGNEADLTTVLDFLVSNDAVSALTLLKLEGIAEWLCKEQLPLISEKVVFLQVARLVFDVTPGLLSKEVLSKVLAFSADGGQFEHSAKASKTLANLGMSPVQPQTSVEQLQQFGEHVLAFVEEGHLDLDKRDAEALILRMQLIQTYGIDKNDMQSALEKFHTYQSHENFGIELVQSKLVQAFCYQAFKNSDETSYKIAETLIIPDEIPVKTISHLILAASLFDAEKSLAIYNEYIGQVTNKLNANTGRSPAGLLTESMMIASLYDNDREFAQLLYEKALAKEVVTGDESSALRKAFKVYGEAFADDSWEKAKPRLLQYVLDTIRKL